VKRQLIVLDTQTCWRLLDLGHIATVELTRLSMPPVQGVPYRLQGDELVLCGSDDLVAAVDAATVCVSAEVREPQSARTWRVVLVGSATAAADGVRVHPTTLVAHLVNGTPPEAIEVPGTAARTGYP
jgi:hypothetical protein